MDAATYLALGLGDVSLEEESREFVDPARDAAGAAVTDPTRVHGASCTLQQPCRWPLADQGRLRACAGRRELPTGAGVARARA